MKLQKLNAKGFAHHLLLPVIVVGVAAVGTYLLVASHADTPSAKISAGQWSSTANAKVVTDGSAGKVEKLNFKVTNKYGTELSTNTGFKSFVKHNLGHKVQFCVDAKLPSKNDSLAANGGFSFTANLTMNGSTGGYVKKCLTTTIAKNITSEISNYGNVQVIPNGKAADFVYVKYVSIQDEQ